MEIEKLGNSLYLPAWYGYQSLLQMWLLCSSWYFTKRVTSN